jgi:hypothetical protein
MKAMMTWLDRIDSPHTDGLTTVFKGGHKTVLTREAAQIAADCCRSFAPAAPGPPFHAEYSSAGASSGPGPSWEEHANSRARARLRYNPRTLLTPVPSASAARLARSRSARVC